MKKILLFFLLSLTCSIAKTRTKLIQGEIPIVAPVITSFSPANGVAGTSVTITGTNFNTVASNNIVFFGATKAMVKAATATSLTIELAEKADFATGSVPESVAIGDLDGNGKPDLAVANSNDNTVSVLRNIRTGIGNVNFAVKADIATGAKPYSMGIGDLDGDGKPELVTPSYSSSNQTRVKQNKTD